VVEKMMRFSGCTALVGDRKGFCLQNLGTYYPSLNVLSLHSPSFSLRRALWEGVKQDIIIMELGSQGNQLTKM